MKIFKMFMPAEGGSASGGKFILKILMFTAAFFSMAPLSANAALNSWQKAASIQSTWSGDFSSPSFKQSVDNLAATNANYVSLVFRIYQSNLYSTDIQTGWDTPTDQALADAIDYIHSKGMKVTVKPHLESWTNEWRAYINPSDRATWFQNYGDFMVRYAQIAQAHGAEDFMVGTELIKMASATENSTNTQNWQNLIGRVRAVYFGQLTYGANWGPSGFTDEKNNIQFWNNLDYMGISAYYNLPGDNSVQNLKNQWNNYNYSDIKPFSEKWGKSVIFTEVGYTSRTNSHQQPWNPWYGGGYDGQEQANDYQALMEYWKDYDFMNGVHWWDWQSNPNAGWPGDLGYTPQHKPAQDTMTQWFGSGGGTQPPTASSFNTSASANPNPVGVGQTTNISVSVTAIDGSALGINVDVEIYSSSGALAKQQVFSNQSFSQGQSQTYNVSFIPSTADTYKVKIGVFNSSWSQLYVWNDNAASFSSTGGSSPPAATIEIWWPTTGAWISGVQPFKAILNNWMIEDYNMYWQVDGGGLVQMWNDYTNYPHKQFDVNLSGWSWRGAGPYKINFVAKDSSGNIISQKSIGIYVSQ